jgi:hypothetical protein
MAKRFCDTEIWDKEWFMALPPKHKCLVRFLFDKCDVAGIWTPNWTLASTYIGEKCNLADLDPFIDHLKFLPGGKIFLLDFIEFQYGKLSESSNPHLKAISILKKNGLYQGYLRGTLRGTSGVLDMDKDKEEEEDKEKEKDKGERKTKFEIVFPFDSVHFLEVWGIWVEYRKEIKKPYRSDKSIQAALQELSKYPEETAIAMIKQSISNSWQGIFELKTNGKQQSTNSQNPHAPSVAATALDNFNKLQGRHNDPGDPGGQHEFRDAG